MAPLVPILLCGFLVEKKFVFFIGIWQFWFLRRWSWHRLRSDWATEFLQQQTDQLQANAVNDSPICFACTDEHGSLVSTLSCLIKRTAPGWLLFLVQHLFFWAFSSVLLPWCCGGCNRHWMFLTSSSLTRCLGGLDLLDHSWGGKHLWNKELPGCYGNLTSNKTTSSDHVWSDLNDQTYLDYGA